MASETSLMKHKHWVFLFWLQSFTIWNEITLTKEASWTYKLIFIVNDWFRSCTDDGKCEVDGAGRTFANNHKDKIVPHLVEKGRDPLNNDEIVANHNDKLRNAIHKSDDSRLQERLAYHIKLATIRALRASRPLFDTLVTITFELLRNYHNSDHIDSILHITRCFVHRDNKGVDSITLQNYILFQLRVSSALSVTCVKLI